MEEIVTIDQLGAQGDGYAETSQGRVFVPLSAPGDRYRIQKTIQRGKDRRAEKADLIDPSPDRVPPPCTHFEHCGGCSLQHLSLGRIAQFKKERLADALSKRGIDPSVVQQTVSTTPGTRRRARFACQKTAKGWIVGFNAAASKMIVPLTECPVLLPELEPLPKSLSHLLPDLPSFGNKGDIQVASSSTGVEICFFPDRPQEPKLDERYRLADWAEENDYARVAWAGPAGLDPLSARRPFQVTLDGAQLSPPPGAFLQASPDGENAIVAIVKAATANARRVADLFAGCGTLSLPLAAAGYQVHAVELSQEMMSAVHTASNGAVGTDVRNLSRNPLTASELTSFDTVIFDPPRAGADAQAQELAASDVATIVAVSCNVATLARDIRTLLDGGYILESATPIDQFTWSAHLEAVAVLRRPAD